MKGSLFLCSLLVALCAAVPTQLTYSVGTKYVYNVTGIVQNNGYDVSSQEFVPGYYSTMQAVMAMEPVEEDDISYKFVMNLYGTHVSVSNSSKRVGHSGDLGEALGKDVFFVQRKTGEIIQIEYHTGDPLYYVNVKASAINAFQTHIVSVTNNTQLIAESDLIGEHSSHVSGAAQADGSLVLTKVFTQPDITAFPDPTLSPKNMNVNAKIVHGVHAQGYIMSSTLEQVVIFTNASQSNSERGMTNSTGFDINLSALGWLTIEYAINQHKITRAFEKKSDGYITLNMFEFAAQASVTAKANAATIDIKEAIKAMVQEESPKLTALTKIGNHLRYNPEDADIFVPFFETGSLENASFRDRVFFVLTVAQNEDFLVKYGLLNQNCDTVLRAVLAAPHIKTPTQRLTAALNNVAHRAECPLAQASALSIVNPNPLNIATDFPYNKSYSGDVYFGGKVIGAGFSGGVFAGTNLDCKHPPNFNYEAYVGASASASLFGYAQEAFSAGIIYGQKNGAPLADALTLSVWGNVVYNQPIPSVTCVAGDYTIAEYAPGFSAEHTVWVSIIPIVFAASGSLNLTASWGWDACATQISTSLSVDGDGLIELYGSSYTDLILVRAGFEVGASINTAIVPKAYVQGTACEIGFEIDQLNTPMDASVLSYFQVRTCKDCKWSNPLKVSWWNWDEPAATNVLFKASYQIPV